VLNAIDLFSGYGGITLALKEYVRPIMYCEIERYCQGILLSRMDDRSIPFAPIWNDVTTINGELFKGLVDIVYGGFPCQDISVAGKGAGLAGERSGLFKEIVRICKEASPQFIFLENVPAIRTRGAIEVQEAMASIGYDTRWCTLSAAEVGANHKRERWFCLAHSNHNRFRKSIQQECKFKSQEPADTWSDGEVQSVANPDSLRKLSKQGRHEGFSHKGNGVIPDSDSAGLQAKRSEVDSAGPFKYGALHSEWWAIEPGVGRVANGVADRTHRIKALGNGVVPLQVKTAFEILMGIDYRPHIRVLNDSQTG